MMNSLHGNFFVTIKVWKLDLLLFQTVLLLVWVVSVFFCFLGLCKTVDLAYFLFQILLNLTQYFNKNKLPLFLNFFFSKYVAVKSGEVCNTGEKICLLFIQFPGIYKMSLWWRARNMGEQRSEPWVRPLINFGKMSYPSWPRNQMTWRNKHAKSHPDNLVIFRQVLSKPSWISNTKEIFNFCKSWFWSLHEGDHILYLSYGYY